MFSVAVCVFCHFRTVEFGFEEFYCSNVALYVWFLLHRYGKEKQQFVDEEQWEGVEFDREAVMKFNLLMVRWRFFILMMVLWSISLS